MIVVLCFKTSTIIFIDGTVLCNRSFHWIPRVQQLWTVFQILYLTRWIIVISKTRCLEIVRKHLCLILISQAALNGEKRMIFSIAFEYWWNNRWSELQSLLVHINFPNISANHPFILFVWLFCISYAFIFQWCNTRGKYSADKIPWTRQWTREKQ